MRSRRAFSLVELLTALVLLAVGLAAFVRAAASVARLEADARLRRTVGEVMRARLDTLRGLGCGGEAAGTAQHGGVRERWRARPDGARLALTDTIEVAARPALARAVASAAACEP